MTRRVLARLGVGALVAAAVLPEVRTRRERHGYRAALGPVEVNVLTGRTPCVDLLLPPPLGSFITATWVRDPATMPDTVRRVQRDGWSTCHVLLNTRPLFLGVLGSNIAEVGIGRRGGVLTWVDADLRRLAKGSPTSPVVGDRAKTPA